MRPDHECSQGIVIHDLHARRIFTLLCLVVVREEHEDGNEQGEVDAEGAADLGHAPESDPCHEHLSCVALSCY